MSHSSNIQGFLLSLLTVFSGFVPHISAAVPQSSNIISNLTLPNLTLPNLALPTFVPANPTSSPNFYPPRRAIQIDATHIIYFTHYRLLYPPRNYFAAIISIQTSLMADYFEHREEYIEIGAVHFDAYGAQIIFDNPTGYLTYALAHRMFGELGEFLMEGNYCTARFELWEGQDANLRILSAGSLLSA